MFHEVIIVEINEIILRSFFPTTKHVMSYITVRNNSKKTTKAEFRSAVTDKDKRCRRLRTTSDGLYAMICRYLVTHLMGADLNNIVKCQKLTDDHVQFLIYQILRGLKVSEAFGRTREISS